MKILGYEYDLNKLQSDLRSALKVIGGTAIGAYVVDKVGLSFDEIEAVLGAIFVIAGVVMSHGDAKKKTEEIVYLENELNALKRRELTKVRETKGEDNG